MTRQRREDKYTFVAPGVGDRILRDFGDPKNLPGLNAVMLAFSVFHVEQAIRDTHIRRAILPIYVPRGSKYDLTVLRDLVRELLIFTLVEDIDVDFDEMRLDPSSQRKTIQFARASAVCLFSGGLDSYAGLLLTREAYESVEGVFCAHADQPRIIHIVENLKRKWFDSRRIGIRKVHVPGIRAHGYAQLRGFLYLLSAAAWVHKLKASRLVVTECGPTMYQPRFSPVDSITMTTHPFVVQKASEAMALLLPRRIKVVTPFDNLTKAEVAAVCPLKPGLKETHSCISSRFGTHDGTCYGCVIRRLATTAAGIEDVRYNKNPVGNRHANSGNLFSLLTFNSDILMRFRKMEEFEIGTIESFGKRDLFERFALDNFAALHRLVSQNRQVQPAIRDLYGTIAEVVGVQRLRERLSELSSRKKLPRFL